MYAYRIFGTPIASEIELPELLPRQAGDPAATVEIAPGRQALDRVATDQLTLEGYGRVGVEDGERLLVQPEADISTDAVRQLVYGPGFRLLFNARGALAIHGSAVAIDGTAVAFLGDSGIGKSTTAAAFEAAGHSILTDDLLVISDPGTPQLSPGLTSLRLAPRTAAQLGLDADTSNSRDAKQRYRLQTTWRSDERYPLQRLYLLDEADRVSLSPVESGEALFALMYYSYNEYDAVDGNRDGVQSHFDQCSELLQSLTIQRLGRPRNLGILDDVVKTVEADLASETGT